MKPSLPYYQNQTVQATLKGGLAVSYKTKHSLTIPPTILFFDIYPKELKTYVHTKNYIQMFIASLFIIAQTWKQPRCPSVGEWIHKLWGIQTMEYYSALKRNELSSYEMI